VATLEERMVAALQTVATAVKGRATAVHDHAASAITSGTLAIARLPVGTASGTVAAGNDSRLSDARTPTAHVHAAEDVTTGTLSPSRLPVAPFATYTEATLTGGQTMSWSDCTRSL
jgi:hypothetical protein